jgi:hypothetical protein
VVSGLYSESSSSMIIDQSSGIFGYVNCLVERDRKYILDTLVNGTPDSLKT